MEWLFYAFITAGLVALSSIFQKGILKHEHALEFSMLTMTLVAIFSFIFLPNVNFNLINYKIIAIIYFFSWLGTLGFYFIMRAIRHMEISDVAPLLNFEVLFTSFLALIILGEKLKPVNWIGIAILFFGAYVLEFSKIKGYKSFIKIFKSEYVFMIFLALVLYSFSSLGDRFILKNFLDPITYLFFGNIFVAMNFFILHYGFYNGKGLVYGFKKNWQIIIIVAFFIFGAKYTQFMAISMVNLALVIGIKRLSSLFSVLIAGEMFHEKAVLNKAIASVFMIIGAYLIII